MKSNFVGSHSAFSSYETCPYQFYRRYIKKNLPKESSPAIARGNAVDRALEDRILRETPLPDDMPYEKFVTPILKVGGVRWVQKGLGITEAGVACDFFHKDVWFRGKPDVVQFRGADAAIIDWKTGNSAYESPSEVERFGALVNAKVPGLKSVSGVYVWLKDGRYGATFVLSPAKALAKIHTQMDEIAQAQKHDDWPAVRNGLCKAWCNVLDCEHNGRRPQ